MRHLQRRLDMSEENEVICLCKYVGKDTIEKAIAHGADTMDKIGRATGATRGACKGKRCKRHVHEMLVEGKK